MQDVNYDGSLVLKSYFPAHQTNEVKAVFLIQQHYMECEVLYEIIHICTAVVDENMIIAVNFPI